ncbi:hypothetical protein CfE428DRAFT_5625 [Chthoniobacter flavus Ellin428]|uniref:Uncharacterized protein n=1 Tax=Chthoniobacter flavus Ellin428 TaxID=497964 RepID=B4D9N5_9BACT|nr:hypothetical protein CfE428DRAFT_5625 [Chthoniobacter flavus Ellin428]
MKKGRRAYKSSSVNSAIFINDFNNPIFNGWFP